MDGDTVTFSVVATGTANEYQWYFGTLGKSNTLVDNLSLNGVNGGGSTNVVSGANTATLTFTNASFIFGQFSCYVTVTNSLGSVTSNVAILTFGSPPAQPVAITMQPLPANESVGPGASFVYNCGASGTNPTFQWYEGTPGSATAINSDGSFVNQNGGPSIAAGPTNGGSNESTLSLDNIPNGYSGSFFVTVTNSINSVTSNVVSITASGPVPPTITAQPQNQTANDGANATFWVGVSGGSATVDYQWFEGFRNSVNSPAISGATGSTLTVAANAASSGNSYYAVAFTVNGSVASNSATLTVNAATVVTPILNPPKDRITTISSGTTVAFSSGVGGGPSSVTAMPASLTNAASLGAGRSTPVARAEGGGDSFQWFFDGAAILGATDSTYILGNASANNNGSYTCLVTNSGGSVMTSAVTLDVVATPDPGRLTNISCRSLVGTGSNVAIAGFTVGGQGTSGEESLLVRASGPALAPFGVSSVLPDPLLQLNNSSGVIASDQGWGGAQQIAGTAASVGAFDWTSAASLDSAFVDTLPAGSYTAVISGASGDTGVALAEVYDATPPGTYTLASPRLINVSARDEVGSGGNILIAGFVIGGTTSKTVLIRGSGPALAQFGLSGVLPDPQIELFQSNADGTSTLIQADTGWGGDTQIAATAASVGAFSWGTSATADSAVLITLPPGSYTAEVSGASGDTGLALVEVYDVQ